jgi:hypothetical protein
LLTLIKWGKKSIIKPIGMILKFLKFESNKKLGNGDVKEIILFIL